MYLKGDKQDWSKIYAMFRLLVDNGMAMGTIDLVAKKDSFKQLIKITRDILNGQLIIIRDNESVIVQTIAKPKTDIGPQEDIYLPEEKTISIPISEIERLSILLLDKCIKEKGDFECEEVETILQRMQIYDFTSESSTGETFQAIFYNSQLDCQEYYPIRVCPLLGKLYLVAANRASNFKYDITQVRLANPEANKINGIGDDESGSLLRLAEIDRLGGKLKFTSTEGKFFLNALQLIDMQLPRLLSEMVRIFYTTDKITVKAITEELNRINLFKVKDEVIEKNRFYEYKIRQFLYAAACGLKPTKVWRGNGLFHLHLMVTPIGELLAYNPVEKEQFEKFLFANTRLSLANETKNKYGIVEKENGQWLIKLNLEMRFC